MSWSMTAEPSAVEVEPGKILMVMRTNWGRLYKSWSFDNGETWMAPTPTPLASSGAPAQVRKVPGTGDLLVVWTQVGEEEMRKGFIRSRLSSAVSRTNGAIWEHYQNVESILEGTRVEPGPIGFVRPEGMIVGPTDPAPERDGKYIVDLPDSYCRCSYPSAFFHKDRLLVGHTNARYDDDDKYIMPGRLIVRADIVALRRGQEHETQRSVEKEFPHFEVGFLRAECLRTSLLPLMKGFIP